MALTLSDTKTGMALPEVKKTITQEHVKIYAEASGDFNPIHLDPSFGEKMGLGGTVAHGMLILAYLSAYMTDNFGLAWLMGGSVNVRLKEAARPGDVITINGKVTGLLPEGEYTLASCEVLCRNQNNEAVITGETKVRLK